MSQVIQYRHFGGPEVLEMVTVPDPTPLAGEVQVAVRAAGLNPIDAKTFHSPAPLRLLETVQRLRHPDRWRQPRFPRVAGRDFAGVIAALGTGLTGLRVGDEVLGTLRSAPGQGATRGSLATVLVAPASDVVAKPAGMGFDTAASLGVAAQTACGALRALDVREGDVLAISAAAGGIGSLATQLAVQRGATVLGIAGPGSAETLRGWGAIPVAYGSNIAEALKEAAPSSVTKFLDCYGGDYVTTALHLGIRPHDVATLVPSPAAVLRGVQFTGSRHAQPGDLQLVTDGVADGTLHVTVGRVLPFDVTAVRAAYEDLLGGHVRGKIVVDTTRSAYPA